MTKFPVLCVVRTHTFFLNFEQQKSRLNIIVKEYLMAVLKTSKLTACAMSMQNSFKNAQLQWSGAIPKYSEEGWEKQVK